MYTLFSSTAISWPRLRCCSAKVKFSKTVPYLTNHESDVRYPTSLFDVKPENIAWQCIKSTTQYNSTIFILTNFVKEPSSKDLSWKDKIRRTFLVFNASKMATHNLRRLTLTPNYLAEEGAEFWVTLSITWKTLECPGVISRSSGNLENLK